MINTRYPVPFIPVSGQVLDGTSSKLKFADLYDLAGSVSVGLYDAETNAIATGAGNGKRFFIGYSSEHTRDFIDKFLFGAQLPKGNPYWEFRGEDVISFEYSDPTRIKGEKWNLGYDGSVGCNISVPKFECGKLYGVAIRLGGSPTYRRWAKILQHEIFTDPICCTEDFCATGCQDNLVDCARIVKELAEKINNHNELKQLGVHARYLTNDYTAPTANMFKYQVTVTDDGSEMAMAVARQSAGMDSNIVRVNRVGCLSTYEVCALTTPASIQQPAAFTIPTDCDVCPAGSTTVIAKDVYTVIRPISETTDLSTPAAQTAFAVDVAADYAATGTFLSFNPAAAVVEIRLNAGSTAPVAVLADTIVFSHTQGVQCTFADPALVAWTQTGTAYRTQRTLCLSLPRKDCALGTTRLAELQAYYLNDPFYKAGSLVVVGTSDGCADTYNLVQWSKGCMEDGCLASDTGYFTDFGAYENNLWEVVEPTPAPYSATKKCGLEITASVPEQYISDCEFELEDFYETEPITMEVSWIIDSLTGFPSNCDLKDLPKAKRSQRGQVSRQDGEWVLREYIKAGAYELWGEDYNMPRMRRVLDSQRRKQVDRTKQYRLYYLQARIHRQGHNFHQEAEVIEAIFAFPRGDQKAFKFEKAFLAPLSKFGVVLKERK